jgi:L-fuculose-phosphate aldolase
VIRVPEEVRRDVLHVCRRLYERGLVAGTDGNVSVRLSTDRLLATPTGMSKGFLQPDDLIVCDMEGRQLAGKRRLTTEIRIHLAAYRQRDDVCAVVHAHPPYATAFAVARRNLDERIMPEAYIAVGKVALTTYGTPATGELEESIRPAVAGHEAILLANHGAMTLGRDVLSAYHRMEALEQLARISALTQLIGEARTLTPEELARLEEIRSVYGSAPANVPCYQCGWSPGEGRRAGAWRAPGETDRSGHAASPGGADEPAPAGTPTPADAVAPRHAVLPRPEGYVEPSVHWPGNPPVWERRGATEREAQVRDLARRALREVRNTGS